jgi:hypothetical protein
MQSKSLIQPLPVLSILVFWLAGTSFGNVPRAIVVLSGTIPLEGRNSNPISCFDSL